MKEFAKNIKFAWFYAKNQKKEVFGFIFLNFLQIINSVISPIVSAQIIVSLTNNKLYQVIILALVMFCLEMIRNFIRLLCGYFSQVTYRETFTRIQLDLGKSILKLTNSAIDNHSSGVFIERLITDTSKIADIFNVFNYYLFDILTNIGIFVAILIVDPIIFIYVFVMVFFIGLLERKRITTVHEKDKLFRVKNEKMSGFIGELVRGVRDIKMLSAEKGFVNELHSRLIDLNDSRYKRGKVNRDYTFFSGSLRDFLNFSLICFLVYYISIGRMSIAIALVVHSYLGKVTYVVNSFSVLIEGIKDFNLSTNRIEEIINGKDFPKEKFGHKKLEKVNGNFEFKDVVFGYKENQRVLDNLSFKIKSGTTTAFVGKSGAGKTTIFHLLCKMYDIDSGSITIDGININELNRESIRDNITIISQNPYLFNVSIRDNLKLVKEDLTDEEMIDACKKACLDELIEVLPDKYDTIVGEGGITLSGGQRQRLAIARALVQKTKIILFDEATSSLDNDTQSKIQRAIESMKGKYTILIIAHRLSTIINSDRILFLEQGKIIAEGTHEELLNNCNEYKELYEVEIEK